MVNTKFNFSRKAFYGFTWVYGGIATVLNFLLLRYGIEEFKSIENAIGKISKFFVIFISIGDLPGRASPDSWRLTTRHISSSYCNS